MSFVIDETLTIEAPPQIVWSVVTDLAAYPAWNPFVESCTSTLAVGAPIDMKVRIFSAFSQPQRETIVEHVPGARLCYGVAGMPFGLLRSRRSHEVRAAEGGATQYRSHFELSGRLAPLVRGLLGARLERGFRAMTRALAARATALHAPPDTTRDAIDRA